MWYAITTTTSSFGFKCREDRVECLVLQYAFLYIHTHIYVYKKQVRLVKTRVRDGKSLDFYELLNVEKMTNKICR